MTASAIRVTVAADQSTIHDFVAANLTATELETARLAPGRRERLEAVLAGVARSHGLLDVTAVSPQGTALLDDRRGGGVTQVLVDEGLRRSIFEASPSATISHPPSAEGTSPASVLTEDLPVVQDGHVRLVFRIHRDAAPILADATAAWRDVVIVTLAVAVVLAALLHLIFRAASARLARQEEQLLEARRRDPLTGLLNHGTVVSALTDLVEQAGGDLGSLGIALVDVDNFRLLNDVHGSPAGDEALLGVAEALQRESAPWSALGRYGPDEFLAVAPAASARDLEAAMKRVRSHLDGLSLQFEGSERLPITVSAGISYYPFHAGAVTELVSAATIALGEAKASGGNDIRIANAWTAAPWTAQTTFDVMQGLVFAIDTKDRYTKRHSEDVARYALFLADRIELADELRQTLRLAGLLHDVGKIGIPDDILRKPGRLTPREYEIVKQHVALGDLIVRDLPDIDLVRAGIRHHHERWDGQGYLDGLAGEDIPLLARILAVGDAFSAMTTTRPYRKAMSVEVALERLKEAAGTQFDASLVAAFVSGIETDAGAPLPGSDTGSKLLWTRTGRAA